MYIIIYFFLQHLRIAFVITLVSPSSVLYKQEHYQENSSSLRPYRKN